jgi:hypothetical protein
MFKKLRIATQALGDFLSIDHHSCPRKNQESTVA